MECKDILNLIAIIVIPIVAVLIGQHLQNRAEIRKDKMHIFKVLMTSRIYGWTQESVHCLNIIDIVFSDDENVRNAWKDLYDKYHLHGGIVRQDKQSGELCICTNNYSDDIKSDSWQLLSDVL